MNKKNDLSNLLSKKVKHNNRTYHQKNNYNRNFTKNSSYNYNSLYENEQSNNNPLQSNDKTNNGLDNTMYDNGSYETYDELNHKNIKIKLPLKNKIIYVAIIPLVVILILLFNVVLLFQDIENIIKRSTVAFGGMYNNKCEEITVIFTDKSKGYEPTGTGTYPVEEYVAGVVYGELFQLATNEEMAKTYALAARTFGLKHVDETCTIESSDRRQVFRDITQIDNNISRAARDAAEATAGQVLISNGELYPVQYDAFCSIAKDDNYYTIKQKNQKIPIEWAEKQGMPSSWLECTCAGNHGRGMSTFGAYYLATEYNYTYDQLISYYYGEDEITISSNSFIGGIEGITSIAGLEIKDTTKASYLQQPITEFLNSKGSSLDNLNAFIHDSVVDQGAGTRAGVVTAAVSMINYLYDNFNVRLPYYWGGSSEKIGLPSSFGTYSPSSVSRGGNVNYYKSFDCSGFVSWAIKNGGYNFSRITTTGFDSKFAQNSCNITDKNCVGQPGDLINSRNGHVELIIAVDQENGKYFIAHSGGPGVVMMERKMHTGNAENTVTKILFMDEFYNNPLNVNPNY